MILKFAHYCLEQHCELVLANCYCYKKNLKTLCIFLFISEANILQETFGPGPDADSFANELSGDDTIDDTIESQRYFPKKNSSSNQMILLNIQNNK